MTFPWPRRLLLVVFVVVGVVGAIQIASRDHHSETAATTPGPAHVTFTPAPDAHDVDPVAPVMVKAEVGTLAGVDMVNEAGTSVQGVMTPDNLVWKPTVPLGYGRTYTLTVTSRGTNGVAAKQVSTFTTLRPSNQTKVSFTTTAEAPLRDGGTYGVGTVIVAHFDEQIADRAAAERHLAVTNHPEGRGLMVLGRRPERALAPGALLRPGHADHGRGANLRNRFGRRAIRAGRQSGLVPDRGCARLHRRRRPPDIRAT